MHYNAIITNRTPPYTTDLAPSDCHFFPTLKAFFGGRRFTSNEEVKNVVKHWLTGLAAEVYDEGIQKLITGYDKCLNIGDDCDEKQLGGLY